MRTKTVFAAMVAAALVLLPGAAQAARFFIDPALGEVPPEEIVTIAEPKPTQLLFSFETNGAANARATNFLNEQVTQIVTERGIFSQVSAGPVEGGAIVQVTIDNIPQADAASRGFGAGLTFGLAGTTVADYYEATIEYVSGPDATPISQSARHTLITAIGRTDPPEGAVRARNANEAIQTIVRQLMARLLNDLAKDSAFSGVAPAPAEAVAATEAPATEAMTPQAPTPESTAAAPAPN
jgi:hypothetical protein